MRHVDYAPYYRSSVGFDRLFSMLDAISTEPQANSYPPYNIERKSEDAYRITMAVAGFAEADLDIEMKETVLTVSGGKSDSKSEGVEVLHRGIGSRAFKSTFHVADHVEVVGAHLENGLLHIDLVREIPEAMKPRKIAIESGEGSSGGAGPKQIEGAATN